jgi:hypothetical protein
MYLLIMEDGRKVINNKTIKTVEVLRITAK